MLQPTLTVSLPALVANWQLLRARFTGEECAAVVKADAYGLGMVECAAALEAAGCHTFFVATLEEALTLRVALPDVRILVFHGVQKGEEFAFAAHRLIPVLNSREQIARWKPVAAEHVHAVSALHVDTAMGRLGLQPEAFHAMMENDPTMPDSCRVGLVMSHLACASEPAHPGNAAQIDAFTAIAAQLPGIPASLANSGGIFLGRAAHFNLARPGCSLYGIAPFSDIGSSARSGDGRREPERSERGGAVAGEEPSAASVSASELTNNKPVPHVAKPLLKQVATWRAPIIMTRTLASAQPVGYGATVTAPRGTRIATVASGYADGYLRYLSNKGTAYVGEHCVNLIGRVTMDMLCFDVTHIPESLTQEGMPVTLLGDHDGIRVDDVAAAAGTIGYEILTRIGARVRREYL